ncbi:OmpA family protein [Actinomadura flavalba]|uniref:OmpA family protein n=1 Tax=Actinomadura flavalba TaxID=1120938 RepID=UPI000364DDFB|nr:OmpA family protein [Actinomadura flavalba]
MARSARYGFRILGGGALCVALVAAGCSGDPEPSKSPSAAPTSGGGGGGGDGAPLAVAKLAHRDGPGRVELRALSRTSDKAVTGTFRVVNEGQAPLRLELAFFETDAAVSGSSLRLSGAGLLDGPGGKLYRPLRTKDGTCLCSDTTGRTVAPGQATDLYAAFPAPPADVSRVTVELPLTVPFADVPLGNGPVARPADQKVDAATADLAAPRVLPVETVVEGDEQDIADEGDERAVRLSADVLFALNKADLTPRADGVLRGVAGQIDASQGTDVRVDGYTDSSGNDAINRPLSERRAATVANRLKTLVTRQGVTFTPAGHGSADPVASNADDRGRRKNRRVTVTFPRPRPPAPPSPAASPRPSGGALGKATFRAADAKGLEATVDALNRAADGTTVVTWTLRNTSSAAIDVRNAFETQAGLSDTGSVVLADPAGKLRYLPARTSITHCLCTSMNRPAARQSLAPGATVTFGGVYKLQENTAEVELRIPWKEKEGATIAGLRVR